MRSFESESLDRIDLERTHQRAREALARDAINITDFKDLYGSDNVERDLRYVEQREALFKKEAEREGPFFSTIFEAIIHERGELSDWFGPDAHTIKASRYDDIHNGVDTIVEFHRKKEGASHLALAIDVTFSPNVTGKFERIKKQIESGKLTHIKYFVSPQLNIRGELTKIPEVVIGADAKTVRNLMSLWLEKDNEKLEVHPIQFLILQEIQMQLRAFEAYARSVGQDSVAIIYHDALDIIEKIIADKEGLREKERITPETLKSDDVFLAMGEYIRRLRKKSGA